LNSLDNIFPEYSWQPWIRDDLDPSFWNSTSNRMKFMDFASDYFRIKSMDHWYRFCEFDLISLGASKLLERYGGSLCGLLMDMFPEHSWDGSDFDNSYWEIEENNLHYLSWIANEFSINFPEDWYTVKRNDLLKRGGGQILSCYDSIYDMLKELYREYEWQPWKFDGIRNRGFWHDTENQMEYLQWLADLWRFDHPDKWYLVNRTDIVDNGGLSLMNFRDNSLINTMTSLYPEYPWILWRFDCKITKGFWDDDKNVMDYLNWLKNQLNINHMDDWYGELNSIN
jgi:hypothetical protein